MNWLQVLNVAAAGDETRKATLRIDGIVGYRDWYDETNNTASHFIRTVDALGDLDEINLEINSPGGVVSDGVAITNYLINHEATVNVTVIGQAASIASVIAMAADPGQLHMGIGTTMFVHDPLTIAIGDADDMRETADHLDKIRDSIVSIYQLRTDLSVDEIKDLMSGDTTMTAEEAVEWGFADTMEAELKAVACADLNEYLTTAMDATKKAMAKRHGQVDEVAALEEKLTDATAQVETLQTEIEELKKQPEAMAATDVITACKEANLPYLATAFIEQGFDQARMDAALAQAKQINDLCFAQGLEEGSEGIITNLHNPIEMLRVALNEQAVALDPDGDNHLSPGAHDSVSGHTPNAGKIYAKRKQ